jgi:superoxide reductase
LVQKFEIYRCKVCGNLVEVVDVGGGPMVCCGESMELLFEKVKDQGTEKHTPVITKGQNGLKVMVGSIPHPMEEEHFIQWIQVIADNNNAERKYLTPNDMPEGEFNVHGRKMVVRAYCSLHGLWKNQ